MGEDEDKGQETLSGRSNGSTKPTIALGAPKVKIAKAKPHESKRKPNLPPLHQGEDLPASLREKEASRIFAFAIERHREGNLEEAVRGYGRTLALNPGLADAYNNLGVALRAQGKFAAAVAAYRRSLVQRPDNPGALSNMGNALRGAGRLHEAREVHRKAVELAPDSVEALYNFGLVFRDLGEENEALSYFERVVEMNPDYIDGRWDRALMYLRLGDFEKGFEEYEWRWRLERSPPREFPVPRWDGSDIEGRTILVHQEQGFGDMINFVRYVPLLKARGAQVVVECQAELARLFAMIPDVDCVTVAGTPIPDVDVHIPMLSLMQIFGTTLETIPADVPYLTAPEVHSLHLPAPLGHLKVGIAWAGKPTHTNDRNRSINLQHFVDLTGIGGITFYSLQKGPTAAHLRDQACEALIVDLAGRIQDFADTASVIAQLDLVITADTAVAHLAGAMGCPVWVALPFVGDWRWLSNRDDNPWYPTLRLFRQGVPGDWEGVFNRLRNALTEVAGSKQPGGGSR